jgi:hypothetical protein
MEGGAIRRHRWSDRTVPVIGSSRSPLGLHDSGNPQTGRAVRGSHAPPFSVASRSDEGRESVHTSCSTGSGSAQASSPSEIRAARTTRTVVTGGLGICVPPGRVAGVRTATTNVTPWGGRDRITPIRPRGLRRRRPHHLLRGRHARQPDHHHRHQHHRACHGTTPVPEGRNVHERTREESPAGCQHLVPPQSVP